MFIIYIYIFNLSSNTTKPLPSIHHHHGGACRRTQSSVIAIPSRPWVNTRKKSDQESEWCDYNKSTILRRHSLRFDLILLSHPKTTNLSCLRHSRLCCLIAMLKPKLCIKGEGKDVLQCLGKYHMSCDLWCLCSLCLLFSLVMCMKCAWCIVFIPIHDRLGSKMIIYCSLNSLRTCCKW